MVFIGHQFYFGLKSGGAALGTSLFFVCVACGCLATCEGTSEDWSARGSLGGVRARLRGEGQGETRCWEDGPLLPFPLFTLSPFFLSSPFFISAVFGPLAPMRTTESVE